MSEHSKTPIRKRVSLRLAALADEHLYIEKGWVGGYPAFCEAVLAEWPQIVAASAEREPEGAAGDEITLAVIAVAWDQLAAADHFAGWQRDLFRKYAACIRAARILAAPPEPTEAP